jgi:hypothetical protein
MTSVTVFWIFLSAVVTVVLSSLLAVVINDFALPVWLRGPRRWVVLVILVLATAALGTYSAATGQFTQGRLEVSDPSVSPGGRVSVSGRGFAEREDVQLDVIVSGTGRDRTVSVATIRADNGGTFETTFVVPLAAVGAEILVAAGERSEHRESTDFAVPALVPQIELSPSTGRAGLRVEVAGEGFLAAEAVDVSLGRTRVSTVTADGAGGFTAVVRIPRSLKGGLEVDISARGRRSGEPFGAARTIYTVSDPTPAPTPDPDPDPDPDSDPSTDPGGGSGSGSDADPPAGGNQGDNSGTGSAHDPPADPVLPQAYRGRWRGTDTSDPSLTTTLSLSLSKGEVGKVVGRSSYTGAITWSGTLKLIEVGADAVVLQEELEPPSVGTATIVLSATSRNTMVYESRRRQVSMARQ